MEEPKGFSDYKARFPDYFPADAPLDKQWKVYEAIAGRMRQVDNAAHMTKVAAAVQVDRNKELNEIEKTALSIYESGKFIQHCKKVFNSMWVGDEFILEAMLYMAANLRVANSREGCHLHVGGDTQVGKSESCRTAMCFLDPQDCILTSVSPKWIYYGAETGKLHERMIIMLDDKKFSEEETDVFRGFLTAWEDGVERNIVVNHKEMSQKIPARVSLVVTNTESVVDNGDDGQDESRFLTINIKRTREQVERIQKFILAEPPKPVKELEIIRAVWKQMPSNQVVVPPTSLEFMDVPMREFRRFLSLIKAHALLCNRTEVTEEDIVAIHAFLTYSRPMLNSTTAGLTNKEMAVRDALNNKWMSIKEICEATKMTVLAVNRALRGREGTYEYPKGGLLSKLPEIERESQKDIDGNMRWVIRRKTSGVLM